jgi:hypothetical protein
MTKTEFTTIAAALKTKQSWVRKGFDEMLDAWEQATTDMEEIKHVVLGKFEVDDKYVHNVFLVPGSNRLYFREADPCMGEWGSRDYYVEGGSQDGKWRDDLSIRMIRWAAPRVSDSISERFKNLQAHIDVLSETGQELRRITNCLNK